MTANELLDLDLTDLAALLAPVSPAAGVLPIPNTPAPLRSAAGNSLHTAASLMTLPYVVSTPAAAAAPLAAPLCALLALAALLPDMREVLLRRRAARRKPARA